MSNQEEFNKLQQIINLYDYQSEKNYVETSGKRFRNLRNLFYIVVFSFTFYLFLTIKFIPKNENIRLIIMVFVIIVFYLYFAQKKNLRTEINRYILNECYPDRGLSRYLYFVKLMLSNKTLSRELLWSNIHYMIGLGLFRSGEIEKASQCLTLMQQSCTTANEMFMAEHLKQLLALYYMDYDTIISCANEADILYSKISHRFWPEKIYHRMQTASKYAYCCKNNDFAQAFSLLQYPTGCPLEEVTRQYYLYITALQLQDYNNATYAKNFIAQNAGTTWYGKAIYENYVPAARPCNYPCFIADSNRLAKPDAINPTRTKYMVAGMIIVTLLFLATLLIK